MNALLPLTIIISEIFSNFKHSMIWTELFSLCFIHLKSFLAVLLLVAVAVHYSSCTSLSCTRASAFPCTTCKEEKRCQLGKVRARHLCGNDLPTRELRSTAWCPPAMALWHKIDL